MNSQATASILMPSSSSDSRSTDRNQHRAGRDMPVVIESSGYETWPATEMSHFRGFVSLHAARCCSNTFPILSTIFSESNTRQQHNSNPSCIHRWMTRCHKPSSCTYSVMQKRKTKKNEEMANIVRGTRGLLACARVPALLKFRPHEEQEVAPYFQGAFFKI